MAWPPPVQKTDWSNADVQEDLHPTAHNDIAITLQQDFEPKINGNAADIATNAADIATNAADIATNAADITDVDDAWQQNETDRDLDFQRGSSPRVRASDSASTRVYLESRDRPYIRALDGAGGYDNVGEIRANTFDSDYATSQVALTSTYKDISGGGVRWTNPGRGCQALLIYTGDFTCVLGTSGAPGRAIGALFQSNDGGTWSEVVGAAQIVTAGALTGFRATLTQCWIVNLEFSGNQTVDFRLYAKELVGGWTAEAQHSGIRLVTFG